MSNVRSSRAIPAGKKKHASSSSAASTTSAKTKDATTPLNHEKKKLPPVSFIAPYDESAISAISLTRAHFLDAYSKGKWNLSKVPCPPCFPNVGFMSPPDCYHESNRRKLVARYLNCELWNEKHIFKKIIRNLRKSINFSGFSISLIDKNRTIIKYEMLLDMSEIPRIAALDAHTILSSGHFLLLDASKDWRTSSNPFVTGLPCIKFYCGVPLIDDESGENIGALAVFDSFAKNEFKEECIQSLIDAAKEIMQLLNTPYEEVVAKYASKNVISNDASYTSNELKELSLKLGRATSRGSISVFEKDGSGNPYSQNHNFRFSKFLKEETSDNDKLMEREKVEIFNKLFRVGSLKLAASILAKTIAKNHEVDFVYFLEIRIAELFTIPSKYFPKDVTKIDAENFKYANKLVKVSSLEDDSVDLMTRIIGIHGGGNYQSLNFENLIHYKAFLSEFGIKYENPKRNTPFNKGIIMPFYRYNCKLIKRDRGKDDSNKKNLNVSLRSGGYLVALFNKSASKNQFDNGLISRVFDNTGILRTIYITGK